MSRKLAAVLAAFMLCLTSVGPATGSAQPAGPASQAERVSSAPAFPTDESKVPHYFGPWPNWANSPFTLPDATVTITGDGSGATAEATVGANGAVTAIAVTDPGSGYTSAQIDITGPGSGALASATPTLSGAVTSATVSAGGAGYTAPSVEFSGGGASTQATATAYGSVDALTLESPGTGYHMPTVSFDLPDSPDGTMPTGHVVCAEPNCSNPNPDGSPGVVTIVGVVLDTPGSGYSAAPNVAILDGTQFDPIRTEPGSGAVVSATLTVNAIVLDTFGEGYTNSPSVAITDVGSGAGAVAEASVEVGAITSIELDAPGSGYVTPGGIQKFTDPLPGLCVPPACPTVGKYIPVAVPEVKTYAGIEADEYVIGLVQYTTSFSSSLPDTLVRGYVQLETAANAAISQHVPLFNTLLDGTQTPTGWYGVTPPQWLGPTIVATKDRPVRIVFYNLLPTGDDGDLFLPTDTTLMGSGMGPMDMADPVDLGTVMDEIRNPKCTEYPKDAMCFKDNRATLHLHGGITPWISDGTPHQWITPAGENTPWPQGVSVGSVPDMDVCTAADDGCQTFYYTNQQSARLMFYHDHAWGITRLNVYAGEAAGYLITDETEQALVDSGTIPSDQLPLVVQDRTFVPDEAQLMLQDPTWDTARWGGKGSFWYHHVYMPAQNPGDPSGMSAYGRWMYGPWFWPPATPPFGPIANPYYDPACDLDDPDTWQYDTDPFCEPELIPGTPNISVGMEQFNDTPVVNGVAYPTVTLEPKAYRLRLLNAANDRFFNFQWYVGDPTTASTSLNAAGEAIGATEVALRPNELADAQTDPVAFPTPIQGSATAGPDWIQIGTEGGFLPAPVVVDGQQPTTWITDPTRFDVGNVDQHSLLLAPAERADAIVDFSKFAGKTLILYNDAPAAFPARVPSYDYYTGAPDLRPVGSNSPLPGYGPNTRTIMQVKIADTTPAAAFNLTKLRAAFAHKANGTGAFESGQHPIIVGQAAYNSAYGTSFAASSNCNAPNSTVQRCDGLVRVNDHTSFGFNTLKSPTTKTTLAVQPKAIHDEMNSTTFDEFGRMQANLGLENQPPTPGLQNVTLYPYVNPSTELIDGTNLPRMDVLYNADGTVAGEVKITPISSATDGTQIWRITHNGVDTHPIHFHLFDVQLVNRVTWDNIILPPDPNELGWKDTVRISPLEDTIVALRPIIPEIPWEIPNAIRPLNPMMPLGSTAMFNNVDAQGNPTAAIVNQLVNFAWEYVYHCHILSHEEMDMMRPMSLVLPPRVADGLAYSVTGNGNNTRLTLTWNDNSVAETSYVIQRQASLLGPWIDLGAVQSPLDQPNTAAGTRSFTDTTFRWNSTLYSYRVVARNTAGYGGAFMSESADSVSSAISVIAAPSNLRATVTAAPGVNITFTDNALNETGFVVERSVDGGDFAQLATLAPRNNTGSVSYTDTAVVLGTTYGYRVKAVNGSVSSPYAGPVTILVAIPASPSDLVVAHGANQGNLRREVMNWTDNSNNEASFTVQRATNATFTTGLSTQTVAANGTTFTWNGLTRNTDYWFRVRANNALGSSAWITAGPITTLP